MEYFDKQTLINKYLTTDLDEAQLIVELDLLQSKTVKQDGVIYTPWNIVLEMIRISNPQPTTTILEPSCGHGIFLFGLLNYMRDAYGITGENLLNWFIEHVFGVDISEDTVEETKEIISLYFKKHFNLNVKTSRFSSNIVVNDGLYNDFGIDFNLCIGNPPYIRTKNLDSEYLKKLRQSFKSCEKGNVDIYYAFIEKCMNIAEELCFITPNSFLGNASAKKLKEMMKPQISLLIDFKEKLVFKDARTYTCIFKTLRGKSINEMLYANDIMENYPLVDKEEVFGDEQEDGGLISTVLSGVATLCDSVYLVKKNAKGKFHATHNGVLYEIEESIVVPYLKLTKIKNDEFSNIDYMIYPYNEDKTVIKEDVLKKDYPLTYKYLQARKVKLLERDKGKTDKYESWYAYGRKQGLHNITENDVIIVPQMIGGECKPQKVNISNLLSSFGRIVFTSGYIIPQTKDNSVACNYLIGHEFIQFAKKNGKPWPGKNESYYSLTAKQIKKFRV